MYSKYIKKSFQRSNKVAVKRIHVTRLTKTKVSFSAFCNKIILCQNNTRINNVCTLYMHSSLFKNVHFCDIVAKL